jgi:CDI immunity proteins
MTKLVSIFAGIAKESDRKAYSLVEKFVILSTSRDIEDFTVEECRFVLSQKYCHELIFKRSLELLVLDIFISGNMYSGDLLHVLLTSDNRIWFGIPEEKNKLIHAIELQMIFIDANIFDRKLKESIIKLVEVFCQKSDEQL